MGTFVGLAAFITMFSTTITCLDALPRAMSKAHYLIAGSFTKKTLAETGLLDDEGPERLAEVPKMYYFSFAVAVRSMQRRDDYFKLF